MDYKGSDGLKYRIQVSVEDCTGCGLCVEACPKKGEALKMIPYEGQEKESVNWAFAQTLKTKKIQLVQGQLLPVSLKNHSLNFQELALAVVKHHISNY